jgi:hypothetical protein
MTRTRMLDDDAEKLRHAVLQASLSACYGRLGRVQPLPQLRPVGSCAGESITKQRPNSDSVFTHVPYAARTVAAALSTPLDLKQA